MKAITKADVVTVLRRYRVLGHYMASARERRQVYAVFGTVGQKSEQICEPTSHKEAQEMKLNLIAADLLELFGVEE
jgi:hypothetical protein